MRWALRDLLSILVVGPLTSTNCLKFLDGFLNESNLYKPTASGGRHSYPPGSTAQHFSVASLLSGNQLSVIIGAGFP